MLFFHAETDKGITVLDGDGAGSGLWAHTGIQATEWTRIAIRQDYTAHQTDGDEKTEWWARATDVWPDYNEYQRSTDRVIPLFVLEPVD